MLHPYATFSLGPFTISVHMLFLIIGIFFSYLFIIMYLKKTDATIYKEVENSLFVSIILAMGIYKLWPFVLQPSLLKSPSNLLYFMGGPFALHVSIGVAALYLTIQFLRKKWSHHIFDSLTFGVVITLLIHALFLREYGLISPLSIGFELNGELYHPINLYKSWTYLLLLISCFLLISKDKRFARSIYLIVGIFFISYLLAPLS